MINAPIKISGVFSKARVVLSFSPKIGENIFIRYYILQVEPSLIWICMYAQRRKMLTKQGITRYMFMFNDNVIGMTNLHNIYLHTLGKTAITTPL